MKGSIILFILSQVIHILANAFYAAKNVNTQWKSIGHYLQSNAQKLMTQLVTSVAVFMIILENPNLLDTIGLGSVKVLFLLHGYGSALLLGWFFDSITEKVLGFWGLKTSVTGKDSHEEAKPTP